MSTMNAHADHSFAYTESFLENPGIRRGFTAKKHIRTVQADSGAGMLSILAYLLILVSVAATVATGQPPWFLLTAGVGLVFWYLLPKGLLDNHSAQTGHRGSNLELH